MSNGADDLPILHVDMDAFYVEVERQRDPTLVGKPVVVGGSSDRGVVASASYEARMRGVRSAMPSTQARKLCPDAVFVSADFSSYRSASEAVHRVFRSVTPLIEPIALDEAFLDVSGAHLLFGASEEIAWRIRHDIADTVGLDCSVGVASNKLLAKLASVAAKPRATPSGVEPGPGVRVVPRADEVAFLHEHPVAALWGVGPATLRRLQGIGVATVGDLSRVSESTLVSLLGEAHGRNLAKLSKGEDHRRVESEREAKSISHEETFARDALTVPELRSHVTRLSDGVARRLRAAGVGARTLTLKVRFSEGFHTITRQTMAPEPIDQASDIVALLGPLVDSIDPSPGVRLVGVSGSNLAPAFHQLTLGEASGGGPEHGTWSEAVDSIRARFGADAIGPASAVRKGSVRSAEHRPNRWGPDEE